MFDSNPLLYFGSPEFSSQRFFMFPCFHLLRLEILPLSTEDRFPNSWVKLCYEECGLQYWPLRCISCYEKRIKCFYIIWLSAADGLRASALLTTINALPWSWCWYYLIMGNCIEWYIDIKESYILRYLIIPISIYDTTFNISNRLVKHDMSLWNQCCFSIVISLPSRYAINLSDSLMPNYLIVPDVRLIGKVIRRLFLLYIFIREM